MEESEICVDLQKSAVCWCLITIILGASHRTIHKHVPRIFAKLGVETRSAAAACADRPTPRSGHLHAGGK